MNKLLLIPCLLLLSLAAGCDLLGEEDDDSGAGRGILVVNQGIFPAGPGSITVYDPETRGTSALEVAGATAQGAALLDGRLFVAANSGSRVDIFDLDRSERVGQVASSLLISPRYVALAGNDRAYVTNLYGATGSFTGGVVSVLDLASNSVAQNVSVGDNPEGIAVAGPYVFVANHGFGAGSTVSVISRANNTVARTLDVCEGPRTIVVDREEDVWVFCTGRTMYNDNFEIVGRTDGGISVIDPATLEVTESIMLSGSQFEAAAFGQDAFYSDETQEIYAVVNSNSVLRISTTTNTPTPIQINNTAGPVSAVAYHDGRLYVAHAPAYDAPGTVTIHDRTGAQLGSFTAGIIPTYILVRDDD